MFVETRSTQRHGSSPPLKIPHPSSDSLTVKKKQTEKKPHRGNRKLQLQHKKTEAHVRSTTPSHAAPHSIFMTGPGSDIQDLYSSQRPHKLFAFHSHLLIRPHWPSPSVLMFCQFYWISNASSKSETSCWVKQIYPRILRFIRCAATGAKTTKPDATVCSLSLLHTTNCWSL